MEIIAPARYLHSTAIYRLVFKVDSLQRMAQVTAHAYVLIPWNRVALEQLTVSQLVKKLPTFYGTRMFITAHTSALHLSLS
jgi:hypothetical protein